ncbi:MAG: ABC transporter permease, partial [Holosporales bacterium]
MAQHMGHIGVAEGMVRVRLQGSWQATTLADAASFLDHPDLGKARRVCLDGQALQTLDTAGAWLIKRFILRLRGHQEVLLDRWNPAHQALVEQAEVVSHLADEKRRVSSFWLQQLETIGRGTVALWDTARAMLSFLGHLALCLGAMVRGQLCFRMTPFVYHLQHVGYTALPIVGLISFLIGIVLVYQGADQLSRFGAEIFTVDL